MPKQKFGEPVLIFIYTNKTNMELMSSQYLRCVEYN